MPPAKCVEAQWADPAPRRVSAFSFAVAFRFVARSRPHRGAAERKRRASRWGCARPPNIACQGIRSEGERLLVDVTERLQNTFGIAHGAATASLLAEVVRRRAGSEVVIAIALVSDLGLA